jgi:hypothetical protein
MPLNQLDNLIDLNLHPAIIIIIFFKYIYFHFLIVIAATCVAANTRLLEATYVWPLIILEYFNY